MKTGKAVIISGGTSGIGRAAATQLLEQGFSVSVFSPSPKSCAAFKKEFGTKYGDRLLVTVADLRNESSVKAVIATTVKKFGGLNVVINNAGYGYFSDIDAFNVEKYKDMISVNLIGPALMVKHSLRFLKKQKGAMIININSTSGKKATLSQLYCSTKFGLRGLTESLAEELKPLGIRVCSVFPGMVDTAFHSKEMIEKRLSRLPKGQDLSMLSPDTIGAAIVSVCTAPLNAQIEDITVKPF